MKRFLLVFVMLIALFSMRAQDCQFIFISEYIEGTGNNKCVEIYNPTDQPVDLADYVICRYSNGSSSYSGGGITDLTGTIPPYGTFVLVNGQTTSTATSPACDPLLQALANQLDGDYPAPMYMNGNDAITLEDKLGVIYDIFGKVGEDPGTGWCDIDTLNYATGTQYWWLAWSKDHTLIRKPAVKHGVFTNPGSTGAPQFFMVHQEWDTLMGYWSEADTAWINTNLWDHLGWHDCECDPTYNSIPDQKRQNEVFFFPNPVDNQEFMVKGTNLIRSVEIVNALGQTVFSRENKSLRGDMQVVVDMDLTGIYFVVITFEDNSRISKKLLFR
jgi:hypothetical protein